MVTRTPFGQARETIGPAPSTYGGDVWAGSWAQPWPKTGPKTENKSKLSLSLSLYSFSFLLSESKKKGQRANNEPKIEADACVGSTIGPEVFYHWRFSSCLGAKLEGGEFPGGRAGWWISECFQAPPGAVATYILSDAMLLLVDLTGNRKLNPTPGVGF